MLHIIEQRLPNLSRAEQRVARWVLSHPREAANAKLAAVAAATETSEPTVIRFCRHLGLEGFRQFTIRLTEAISRPAFYVHRNVSQDDATADAVTKVMDASIRTLIDVRAKSSSMDFEAAIAILLAARQIAFAGLGASGRVAADAQQKFFRLGIPCSCLTDTPTLLQFAATANAKDVLIIVSSSGDSKELIATAEAARSSGIALIALTEPTSPVAQLADVLLPCDSHEEANVYTPQSSRLAHLALLDALQVCLALSLGDDATDRLRESKQVLEAWQHSTAPSEPNNSN